MKKAAFFFSGVAIGTISYYAFKKLLNTLDTNKSNEIITNNEENTIVEPVDQNRKYSIIYIIRKDLKMRNGKISAQVGHASLGIFLELQDNFPELTDYNFEKELFYCQNEEVQNQKMSFAEQNGLCSFLIYDQGRTQIAAGSATVLAIAPVESDIINIFTEGLIPIPKK
ncbi:hypothetical protein M9Y10_016519 [Tritrichomonas musculus]|uniref:peptidyl-tRNA hydrolase n=1 Tax=Tritrichomonas musculus TaxID=1915356 RepID=A0ABR2HWJ3_9EUKA